MLDIEGNRKARKWTMQQQMARVAWRAVWPLFALSPRPLWAWRRVMLRAFGAEIGRKVCVHPRARIVMPWNVQIGDLSAVGDRAVLYALGPVSLGTRVTVSQDAYLCGGTHDWRKRDRPLLKLAVIVEDDAWICAGAFVGPGVTVGRGAIVGARAVVVKNVPGDCIAAGNPARLLRTEISQLCT